MFILLLHFLPVYWDLPGSKQPHLSHLLLYIYIYKLSSLLDLILKPLAFQVKSYVKDSFHFLEMLPKSIEFDSTFVTFDVTSLYTNIPKELGLEALSFWIDRFPESLTESRFTKSLLLQVLK